MRHEVERHFTLISQNHSDPTRSNYGVIPLSNQSILNREDSEVIVRMLYYCSEPRIDSQIKSYCEINQLQFDKFAQHCMRKGLLKMFLNTDGEFCYVVTDAGKRTLVTAQEIMKALAIDVNL